MTDLADKLDALQRRFRPESAKREKGELAIGIDLGTTYSCVAVYKDDRVKVIANDKGNRITPSCVSFTPNGMMVGDDAKLRLSMNPQNTVYEVKRLIGKSIKDETVQTDIKSWPFKVVSNGGKPGVSVEHNGETKEYSPEEISSHILAYLKEMAERHLRQRVTKAVVTVPAYFNDNQRQATITAAKLAGLQVLRIINEPTAAALAYQDDQRSEESKDVLVFDLGGGTFDVSVLNIEGDDITVSSTRGNSHLGGADFDTRLVDHIIEDYKKDKSSFVSDKQSREIMRLRRACESAKCSLTDKTSGKIHIDDFHGGKDLERTILRSKFNEINEDLFKQTLVDVKKALDDAELDKSEVSEIVLVGGSTRVQRVRELLKKYFNGKQPNQSIHPDEAVAYGAAIQAALLNGAQAGRKKALAILDVTPLSMGVNVTGGIMSTIVKRNTNIPINKTRNYLTSKDNQCSVTFSVYQGERTMVSENTLLGQLTVDGIPPAPEGVEKIDCTFSIDANGGLTVIAKIKSTGKEKHITIQHDKVRATEADVRRMIENAEKCQNEDQNERERINARNSLETFAHWMKYIVKKYEYLEIPGTVISAITETSRKVTKYTDESTGAYKRKEKYLRDQCNFLDRKYRTPGTLPAGNPERPRAQEKSLKNDKDID